MEKHARKSAAKRGQIEELLSQARRSIGQREMQQAFETLLDLELMEFPDGACDLQERLADLSEEAEQVEREMALQRLNAEECCASARRKLLKGDVEGAREDIERAAAMEACRADEVLQRQVEKLESMADGTASAGNAA